MVRQPVTRERVPEGAAGDVKNATGFTFDAGGVGKNGGRIAAWLGPGPNAADEQPGDTKKHRCLK